MKFFTPKRLVQLQDRSSQRRFLAAFEAWENAIAAYRQHIDHIKGTLPLGLRRLVSAVALHDAKVIDISQGNGNRFTIILQPESDPSRQVVLSYFLAEPAQINHDALPREVRSEPLSWLYDEVDADHAPSNGKKKLASPDRMFWHCILLSNGWEVRLHFRTVTVTRPESLVNRCPDNPAFHGTGAASS